MILINGTPLTPTLFPDKTSQVWNIPIEEDYYIEWRFESEAELMHLAQLKILLDQYDGDCELYIPYLPYARQDKGVENDKTFALHAFAYILNSLNFDVITTFDVHSWVALNQINNLYSIPPRGCVEMVIERVGANIMCYPDQGAIHKYSKKLSFGPFISGNKVRDKNTGCIVSYTIEGNVQGKSVLIVDDICDGGATFIALAKLLYEGGAIAVYLYVSHGIFSRGLGPLKEAGIMRIFTKEGERSQ